MTDVLETLLTPTGVKLFGRTIKGLTVDLDQARKELGNNNFLRKQLEKSDAKFARIYGFSYEGNYYDMPNPAIFLVHTDGTRASPTSPKFKNVDAEGQVIGEQGIGAVGPGTVDQSGVAAKSWDITEGIMYWDYDKGDFSLRLDIVAGPFEQILLGAMLSPDRRGYSGAEARVRTSGAEARSSGAEARSRIRGGWSD